MKKTNKGLDKFENELELAHDIYEHITNNTDIDFDCIDTRYRFMLGNHQLDLLPGLTFNEYVNMYITSLNVLMRTYMEAVDYAE